MKKIFIASDHAGFELKNILVQSLRSSVDITDLGPNSADSVDYPDFAKTLSQKVLSTPEDRKSVV